MRLPCPKQGSGGGLRTASVSFANRLEQGGRYQRLRGDTPATPRRATEGADQAWHLGTRLAVAESLNLSLQAGRRAREGEAAAHELALLATLDW